MGKRTIYPTTHKKYVGCSLKQMKEDSFTARIDYFKNVNKRVVIEKSNFKTYNKALRWIRKKHIKHNIKIRNIVSDKGAHYECVLSSNHIMKFDKDDLDKVQKHTLFAHNNPKYGIRAKVKIKGKNYNFANIIMSHTPSTSMFTVDHIDRDPLNNMKSNLRLATQTEQIRNRGLFKNNKSGFAGVSFRQGRDMWVATWYCAKDENNKSGKKSKEFSCKSYGYEKAKQMAIDHRNKMVIESDYYKNLWNKPTKPNCTV